MGFQDYLRFVCALAFVLALMGLTAYVLRRFSLGQKIVQTTRRLSVIETRAIDARHRLVLVKCDDTEHLLVISPDTQTVLPHKVANDTP